MYKDGVLTITDWQKGQAQSPFLGFPTIRNCEVFDNPGIVKISKQLQDDPLYGGFGALPIKRIRASNGAEFLLTQNALFRNGASINSFVTTAYDMVEYKGYIIVSFAGGLFAYGLNTLRLTNNFKTGLNTAYYIKLLVGQDDILYITNGQNIASLTNFVAGTPSTDPTATLNTSAIDLPDGQYAVTMAELGRNLMIGTQGGTNWSQRGNQRIANIYPWDRKSPSFNIPVQIQEAGVHAMLSVNNVLYVCAGTAGNVYVTDGTSYRKIVRLPWSQDRNISNSVSYFPNSITTNVNNNLLIGVSSGTGSQDQLGIYEISLSDGFPVVLKNTPEFYLPGDNIQIGFVDTSSQGETYVGYGKGTNYYAEKTLFNAYVGFKAVIESPLYRVGTSNSKKTFQHMEFTLAKPLTFQHEIRFSYRKDTQSDYVDIGTFSFADLGSKISHLFSAHIASAEVLQIKIELNQNEYTSPNPTNWDLELLTVRLW